MHTSTAPATALAASGTSAHVDWPSIQAVLHITCEGDRIIVCVGRLTCNGHTKPIVHMLLCHHQTHEDARMPRSTVRKHTLPSCMACTSARCRRSHTPLTPAVQHHHQQRRLLGGRLYCAVRLQRPLAIATFCRLVIRRRRRHHDDAALVTRLIQAMEKVALCIAKGAACYPNRVCCRRSAARCVLQRISEPSTLQLPDRDLLSESELSC